MCWNNSTRFIDLAKTDSFEAQNTKICKFRIEMAKNKSYMEVKLAFLLCLF